MGYYEWPLSSKIDWQIDNYLPWLMAWTTQWVAIADEGTFPVLITHQDDLRCNEKAFFDAILSFYEMRLDFELPNLARTLDETHSATPPIPRNGFEHSRGCRRIESMLRFQGH